MEKFELRIVGTGGNGIILTGLILASASMNHDELYVAQTQAYSPESRGGYCKSELQLSKKEILFPKVTVPNLFATLSETTISQDMKGFTSDTLVIADDGFNIENFAQNSKYKKILQFPFFSFTHANFRSTLYTNMVFMGVLSHYLPWISSESILHSIREKVKNKNLETNLKAFIAGTTLNPSRILDNCLDSTKEKA